MKVAFVNQPIDTILPPYQSSVGACTYGAALSLARSCEVVVYGTRDRHKNFPAEFCEQNVHFRFFPVPLTDRLGARAKEKYSKLVPSCSPSSSSGWLFRTFGHQVAEDLRLQDCDVIQLQHCSQYAPTIRALNPNAKIILHLHAEWFSQNRPEILAKRLRHVDLVTTVSDYVTEKTRRLFPMIAARCQTMYNAVDAAEFARHRNHDLPQRREKNILYSGAVSPHKGLHILMDAFSLVVEKFQDVRLDVVGGQWNYHLAENFDLRDRALIESVHPFYAYDLAQKLKEKLSLAPLNSGTYTAHLKQRLSPEARGRVEFHGFVPRAKLIDHYYDADLFAFAPIWDEGFGIPPVEAMAAGVPVVATRSGAIPEMVRDQQTGFVVSKNDPGAIAEHILRLLRNDSLRAKMGRAARNWVYHNFIWDRVAEKMYRCYLDLCKTGAGAGGGAVRRSAGAPRRPGLKPSSATTPSALPGSRRT